MARRAAAVAALGLLLPLPAAAAGTSTTTTVRPCSQLTAPVTFLAAGDRLTTQVASPVQVPPGVTLGEVTLRSDGLAVSLTQASLDPGQTITLRLIPPGAGDADIATETAAADGSATLARGGRQLGAIHVAQSPQLLVFPLGDAAAGVTPAADWQVQVVSRDGSAYNATERQPLTAFRGPAPARPEPMPPAGAAIAAGDTLPLTVATVPDHVAALAVRRGLGPASHPGYLVDVTLAAPLQRVAGDTIFLTFFPGGGQVSTPSEVVYDVAKGTGTYLSYAQFPPASLGPARATVSGTTLTFDLSSNPFALDDTWDVALRHTVTTASGGAGEDSLVCPLPAFLPAAAGVATSTGGAAAATGGGGVNPGVILAIVGATGLACAGIVWAWRRTPAPGAPGPRVRNAEARLAAAQRAHDEARARLVAVESSLTRAQQRRAELDIAVQEADRQGVEPPARLHALASDRAAADDAVRGLLEELPAAQAQVDSLHTALRAAEETLETERRAAASTAPSR